MAAPTPAAASAEKLKCHHTGQPHRTQLRLGSRGHLLVGDMQMLSHGLRSGCHGDRLFKFAFRIQPEFSGNLSRTKQIQNALILPSKDSTTAEVPPQARHSRGSRNISPQCQGLVSQAESPPVGDRHSAGSRDGRPDPWPVPSPCRSAVPKRPEVSVGVSLAICLGADCPARPSLHSLK